MRILSYIFLQKAAKALTSSVLAITAAILMTTVVFAYTGSGTKADPYIAATLDDLRETMPMGGYVKLGGNISDKYNMVGKIDSSDNDFIITIPKTTYLDLNGYKLNINHTVKCNTAALFKVNGTLTIDSSRGGTLSYYVSGSSNTACCIYVSGRAIINNCTMSGSENSAKTTPCLIYNNGYTEINGENTELKFIHSGFSSDPDYTNNIIYNSGSTLLINGASLQAVYSNSVRLENGAKLYMNGGYLCEYMWIPNGRAYISEGKVDGCSTYDKAISYTDNIIKGVSKEYTYKDMLNDKFPYTGDKVEFSRKNTKTISNLTLNGAIDPEYDGVPVIPTAPADAPYTVDAHWHYSGSTNNITRFEPDMPLILSLTFTPKESNTEFCEGIGNIAFPDSDLMLCTNISVNAQSDTVTADYTFKIPNKPIIVLQPQDVTDAVVGGAYTFTVDAKNADTYLWRFVDQDGVRQAPQNYSSHFSFSGKDTNTLTVSLSDTTLHAWTFYCDVSTPDYTVTTDTAVLKISRLNGGVYFDYSPVEVGTTLTAYFSEDWAEIASNNRYKLTYQWQKLVGAGEYEDIEGATEKSYTVQESDAPEKALNGAIRLIVTAEDFGITTSNAVTLKNYYTVTYDANGHGTSPDPLNVRKGNTVPGKAMSDADGYKFGGWFEDAECTVPFDFNTPCSDDVTLYAKWALKELDGTARVEPMRAYFGDTLTLTTWGTVNTLRNTSPTAVHYQWQRNTNRQNNSTWQNIYGATSDSYKPKYTDQKYYIRCLITADDYTGQVVAQDTYLTPVSCKVSFDAGEGSGSMNTVSITAGEYTLPMSSFTPPSGKDFIGWDKGNVGRTVIITEDTTVTAKYGSVIDSLNLAIPLPRSVTKYLHYSI